MNRKHNKKLLTAAGAIAGVALGTTLALAAHPPVQLFTYEELSLQFGMDANNDGIIQPAERMPVMVDANGKGMPYSPKQSCGVAGCHIKNGVDYDYAKIANHAFHSNQGTSEMWEKPLGKFDPLRNKPWTQSPGMTGKWCNPSLRQIHNMMDQDTNTAGIQPVSYGATAAAASKMITGDSAFYTAQTKVDMSAWDQAVACGSCHPGGTYMEMDRNGLRYSYPQASPFNPQMGFTPYNSYVYDRYDALTGTQTATVKHSVEVAPWSYPMYNGATPVTAPGGWGQPMTMIMPDGVTQLPVFAGQVMMPNVKEFDCLVCHGTGFNTMMSSMMTYSGAFNAVPSFGAGFMNMFTEAYDFTSGLLSKGTAVPQQGTPVFYTASNLKGNPASENCQACHLPSKLKDIPDMFRDFLSSAPMKFTNSFGKSFTGLSMPAYDMNAPFGMLWTWTGGMYATSPVLTMDGTGLHIAAPATVLDMMIPGNASNMWPVAMGATEFNVAAQQTPAFFGGGNDAGSGPIYFQATIPASGGMQDQMVLKKSVVPFPRSEWFKRGDVWIAEYDVHKGLECAGCHMDTATTKVDNFATGVNGKSLCDPGRGIDELSAIETSGTGIANVGLGSLNVQVNSQETVKMCDSCHVTGKNRQGVTIDTKGAPNIVTSHNSMGFGDKFDELGNRINGVKAVKLENGVEVEFVGSHMDILDCTVCHLTRKQMVVRSLDSSSGNRYPNMVGINKNFGMMGMFTDPFGAMTEPMAMMQVAGALGLDLQAMGTWTPEQLAMFNQYLPMYTFPRNNNEEAWTPFYTWQKWGDRIKTADPANWRRKIYASNFIDAVLWNNFDTAVDANGDGIPGRPDTIHAYNGDVEPTFNLDPWIMRDMKEGMNFGPSGFAPIPVGFGGGAYQSAYAADGSFTGAWNYVGLYGGNVVFSTPEEISAYKTFRNSFAEPGKSWDGTRLIFSGVHFKLTHGIRPITEVPVKGKVCTDCHAADAGFFDGGFDMLGTAIKATAGGKFMSSPAEPMQVVAHKEDIETGAELARKDGGLLEMDFEELGDWNAATKTFTPNPAGDYKRVTPLDRGKSLYPEEKAYTGADGTVYPTRAAWLDHLLNLAAEPVAAMATVPGVLTPATQTTPAFYTIPVGTPAVFTTVVEPGFSYDWSIAGQSATGTGASFSYTPTTAAGFYVNLIVTNDVTGAKKLTRVLMKSEAVISNAFGTVASVVAGTDRKVQIALSGMPTHTGIQIAWGDGSQSNSYAQSAATFTPTHFYYGKALSFTATVKLTNAGRVVAQKNVTVTLPDVTKPVISAFTLGAFTTPSVAVTAITATDNVAVTGYAVTNSATAPLAAAITSATAPASYTFASGTTAGAKTLYAWVKDAAGNVSLAKTASVTITAIP
jgi:hypothetical protein